MCNQSNEIDMATKEKKSVFETLNAINCNGHVEVKDMGRAKLTYLSWAWAWAEVKKAYPEATYTIYENADGWNYHTDGKTAWVKTGVTIEGIEHIEYLPVMDNRNASIPLERITSFDVNKAIQRSLTKAAARHGLGLYIYAGEDLPEGEQTAATQDTDAQSSEPQQVTDASTTTSEQQQLTDEVTTTVTDTIKAQIAACTNFDELMVLYRYYVKLQSNSNFLAMLTNRKKEVAA